MSDYSKNKFGFSIGFGNQKLNLIGIGANFNVDYSYDVLFTQLNYIYSFFENNYLELGFSTQSEYGITTFKSNKNVLTNSNSYEIGISGGVVLSYKIFKENLHLYLLIAAGPHYSEKSPERQVSGFMFNSNFDMGFYVLIKKNLQLDFRTGFRHLSNAGIQNPNGGINNWMVMLGLLYQLEDEFKGKKY